MRLTARWENASAKRSAWVCWLAPATITTNEAPTILSLRPASTPYLREDPAHRRPDHSPDRTPWTFANTRFTGIATVLWAAATTRWAKTRWSIFADCSPTFWTMARTGFIRRALA